MILNDPAFNEAYESMMEVARMEMGPDWKQGQMIVLETFPGEYHWAKVEDLTPSVRESIEQMLIEQLMDWNETRVLSCLCTMDGQLPEIPSRHLRKRLLEIHPENGNTVTFLWGGGEQVHIKPFSALIPPKNIERK